MVGAVSLLRLACGLPLALVAASALAWVLARGMGLRLPWKGQALGLALPAAILLPLLAGGRLLAPTDAPILANLPDAPRVAAPDAAHGVFNDAILQLLPWEAEVRRGFGEGHLPLWSDRLDGGASPWVNPQAGVLSPIAILGRLVPVEHFLLAALAVKMLLALDGCWLLARQLGASRLAAALAGGAFALGGPLVAWAVFPLTSVVAWSPWLALAAIRVVRRPARRRVAAAALVLAALLLSGHPEIALAAALLAAGCGAIAWRRRPAAPVRGLPVGPVQRRPVAPVRRRRGVPAVPAAAALAAAALGTALAACQLLPFLLAAPRSLRAVQATATAAAAVSPPAFRWFPGGGERLFLSPLNPWVFGRPFHEAFSGPANWPIAAGAYLGLVALAGIAVALVGPRRRLALSLAGLALLLFLAAARFYPIWRLVTSLPLGSALAVDRFLPVAALPLALLAALGIDHLRRGASAAGWAAALLAAAASLLLRHDPPLLALWALVALGMLGLARGRPGEGRRRRVLGPGLLAAATLLDLGAWDRDALPRGHRQLFYPRTPLIEAIAAGASGGPPGPWRAVAGGFSLYPSLLPMYGVAEARIDNPMAPAVQVRALSEIFEFQPEGRRYKSAFRHLDHPLLDFLNVRIVVLADAALAGRRPLELLRGEPPLRVYLNPAALPRWFLATGADPRRGAGVLRALREMRDPRRVVLDAWEVGAWRPPERPWDAAAVRALRARGGAVTLALPPAGEKLLATSLASPEGWRAVAGGRRLRTVTVNSAYLGVVVPAGVARVDLAFAPPGFFLGAALSSLAALAVTLLAAWPGGARAAAWGSR